MVINTRQASLILALLPGLWACGSDETANPIRAAFAAESSTPATDPPVALRFPTTPGPGVRIYRVPTMSEVEWRFHTPALAADGVVGFVSAERQVYVQTQDSSLVALDLESGVANALDSAVATAAIGPTGLLHLVGTGGGLGSVAERHVEPWDSALTVQPSRVWGTIRSRLVVSTEAGGRRRLDIFTRSEHVGTIDLPTGLVAVSRWGDLVAVATDSGLVAIRTDPSATPNAGLARLDTTVTALTFSAAGHRLFAATADRELLVINRFRLSDIERFPMTHRVVAMRSGPQGRYLLLRPEVGDSVWIADAADPTQVVAVRGTWDRDLPAIAGDGTVLVRRGSDIVALNPTTGTPTGRVNGGAADRWLVMSWNPRQPTLQLAQERETAAGAEGAGEGVSNLQYYAQLSSTSNEAWALARRDELLAARLPAKVIYPYQSYDSYRVVLGPFATSEEAHDLGRRLGQPYFVITWQDTTATIR